MGVMNVGNETVAAATRELRTAIRGKVVVRGDDAYSRTRLLWNGVVSHQPAIFAICETTKDTRQTICTARLHRLPLPIRGGNLVRLQEIKKRFDADRIFTSAIAIPMSAAP
jgi:hypothetical protein